MERPFRPTATVTLTDEEWAKMEKQAADALDDMLGYTEPKTPGKDPYKLAPEEHYIFQGLYGPQTRLMPNHLYFIKCGEFLKIGIAADVRKRVKDMEMNNPHEMEVIHVMLGKRKEEKELHLRFADYRHRNEWFRFEGELREYVEGLVNDAST